MDLLTEWLADWAKKKITKIRFRVFLLRQSESLGNLRSYDGNCNENATLKLNFALSFLRLFYVDHVVKNRRTALSLAWHECFSCKGKEWKIYCCDPALSSEPQIYENFTSSFSRLRQNIASKSVPHVQHDYFSSSYARVVHTTAKQIISRRRKNENVCEMPKMKTARAKRAKLLFFAIKHANLWRSCCRRRGCVSSLLTR